MELRILILKLNSYDSIKNALVNNDLEIKEEQLADAYNIIYINGENCRSTLNIHKFCWCYYDNNHRHVFINQNFINDIYEYNAYGDYVWNIKGNHTLDKNNDELRYGIYLGKLPCILIDRNNLEIPYLANYYKITKISDLNMFYMEQKGTLTKAAIKNKRELK